MVSRKLTLIAVTDGIEGLAQETTGGALAGRVRARIARRPGRWRARMRVIEGGRPQEPVRPEAA